MGFKEEDINASFVTDVKKEYITKKPHYLIGIQKPSFINPTVVKRSRDFGMQLKSEFHISVITGKIEDVLIQKISTMEESDQWERYLSEIEEKFKEKKWHYRLLPEYFLMMRSYPKAIPPHDRRTIIQMVELPDLPDFYEEVNKTCGTSFQTPPAHVTLFCLKGDEKGIGIYSQEDFQAYVQERIE